MGVQAMGRVIVILAVLLLSACSTTKKAFEEDKVEAREMVDSTTEKAFNYVVIMDSVVVRDVVRGDTVVREVEKWKNRNRYIYIYKDRDVVRTDTIVVTREVLKEKEGKSQVFSAIIGGVLGILLGALCRKLLAL